jgi:hypothetical protein
MARSPTGPIMIFVSVLTGTPIVIPKIYIPNVAGFAFSLFKLKSLALSTDKLNNALTARAGSFYTPASSNFLSN